MNSINSTTLFIAGILYSAYCESTGFKSVATGADLPHWDELVSSEEVPRQQIVAAWCATAEAAVKRIPICVVPGQADVTVSAVYPEEPKVGGFANDEYFRQIAVIEDKAMRERLDAYVHHLKTPLDFRLGSAERTLAMRHLQQARHWLGEDLGCRREPYPYPNGNDATKLDVDPAADTAQGQQSPMAGEPRPEGSCPQCGKMPEDHAPGDLRKCLVRLYGSELAAKESPLFPEAIA